MQGKRDQNEMLEDFIAAYRYLKSHKDCNGTVGVVGFCFGGWVSNMMAVKLPDLAAAVPYYGRQPESEDAIKVKAPLLLQYADLDKRVNAGWPDFEKVLKENNITHEAHFYADVNHGFHNNTTPRYDQEAADLSWERTIAFFKTHLKS
jgi:carboxymethylenebutenolidase